MEQIFLNAFRFFQNNRTTFWLLSVVLISFLIWRASSLDFEEDITKLFPSDKRVEKLNDVFQNSKLAERIVVMVSARDSTLGAIPDTLVQCATELVGEIDENLSSHISDIKATVDDEKIFDVFKTVQDYLPVFLNDKDYVALDSMLQEKTATQLLQHNYRQLISPTGIATKNFIVNDPLGISFLALKKLQGLQFDENFVLFDDYILTKDHHNLIFFIQPKYSPNDTKNNGIFLDELTSICSRMDDRYQNIEVSTFGSAQVALGNARQLRADTVLTVGIMLIILIIALLGFFRKKRMPFLILIPVVFGALFSLALISFFQSSLSILALAVGAVILGVAIDYSLHYFVLLKDNCSHETVLKQLVKPLTIGSATTVLAFLCLQFTNANVLRDIGLFAGLSLVGAALCSLLILPQIVGENVLSEKETALARRIADINLESSKPLIYAILILTPVFFYFASKVKFNENMSSLNYMTAETRAAEKRLESINKASLSAIYIVSSGNDLESALIRNEIATQRLESLKDNHSVKKIFSVSSFVISDSLQRIRIARWNNFWHDQKKTAITTIVRREGIKLHYSPIVLSNFDSLLNRRYELMSDESREVFRRTFFNEYIFSKGNSTSVITLAHPKTGGKELVYNSLAGIPAQAFDRQIITNLFIEYVNADFNFIVTVTSVIVFLALFLVYGRIEITLITFIPMIVTWIWILGIMALVGIEFNIVNVMVSTFIFGLGDDYSIFIMDGLQEEYRSGKKILRSVKTSIFLSAFTTIVGLGVLIFAKHPALKSIAGISIIGIACVFIMSQTLEPYFFRMLIINRTKKGFAPMTLRNMLITVYTYTFFIVGSFVLTAVGLILKAIPFGKSKVRFFFHGLIRFFTRALVYGAFNLKKQIRNANEKNFARASVIIANHSSFMDILLSTMLHPRLIMLTNKWVWNSPVFGGVVRLADYYPVMDGAEDSVNRLRSRIKEGYSVVVFPEGTRSIDGKINRFHKGAFFLAESLQLPIQPLLIHGADHAIRKNDIYVNDSTITLKFLPPIEPNDSSFGRTYSERTKNISKYFREEHLKLKQEQESPHYFRFKLFSNYLYKGPVLEWYMRIKVALEKDYTAFNDLIPRKATILDLGCGYGFLSYMLQFVSDERHITAVDYDEEKIETAQHGYLRTDRLQFHHADITKFPFQSYDVIIISDVLHYLSTQEQDLLIERSIESLRPGGKLIIRDGNKDLGERHKGTRLTEFFSVKVLKFNKSRNSLNFISGKSLAQLAQARGLKINIQDESQFTSNVIFVISKPQEVHETV